MTALFASPGMTAVTVVVLILEGMSLLFLAVCSIEYRMLIARHTEFFRGIGNREHDRIMRRSRVFLWIYIATTILITLATGYLFLFQPHIL